MSSFSACTPKHWTLFMRYNTKMLLASWHSHVSWADIFHAVIMFNECITKNQNLRKKPVLFLCVLLCELLWSLWITQHFICSLGGLKDHLKCSAGVGNSWKTTNQQLTRCQIWYKSREWQRMQKEASVAKRHWGKSQRSQKNCPLNNSIK